MNSHTPLTPADLARVAAYADNTLSPADKAQFEAELATNPALREELDLQTTLDASLNRLFEYTEPALHPTSHIPHSTSSLPSALSQSRRGDRFPLSRLMALAAALILAVGAAWYFTRPDPNLIPPQQVWANMEKANFVPTWRCENEAIFRDYLNTKLGESFAIDESESLRVVGWGYAADYKFYPLSEQTLTLINKVGNEHAVVLIDKAKNDRNLTIPPETGLHLYKKRVGDLVLYEMSPLPEPHVLPKVRI